MTQNAELTNELAYSRLVLKFSGEALAGPRRLWRECGARR